MPWECVLYAWRPTRPTTGAMWYAPDFSRLLLTTTPRSAGLSREYMENWFPYRPPIFVLLPDGTEFCVDGLRNEQGDGWMVSGMPPRITLAPVVETAGYFGYLHDGRLGEDLKGRTYGSSGSA